MINIPQNILITLLLKLRKLGFKTLNFIVYQPIFFNKISNLLFIITPLNKCWDKRTFLKFVEIFLKILVRWNFCQFWLILFFFFFNFRRIWLRLVVLEVLFHLERNFLENFSREWTRSVFVIVEANELTAVARIEFVMFLGPEWLDVGIK